MAYRLKQQFVSTVFIMLRYDDFKTRSTVKQNLMDKCDQFKSKQLLFDGFV